MLKHADRYPQRLTLRGWPTVSFGTERSKPNLGTRRRA